MMYEYNGIINRVIDGDTIDLDIDLGFDVWMKGSRVRLVGLDAPESRTRDKKEDALGEYAKELITEAFPEGERCVLQSMGFNRGKYGRVIGDVCVTTIVATAECRTWWSSVLKNNKLCIPELTSQEEKTAYWHRRYSEMVGGGILVAVDD